MSRKGIKALVLGVAAVLAGGALAGCASPPAAEPSSSIAPFALDQDFADPGLLRSEGTYAAFGTNTPGVNVQVATSVDSVNWELLREDALPDLPAWASEGRTWAPSVTFIEDRYVMHFTAAHTASDKQCIGVATSTALAGPYEPVPGDPIVCTLEQGGAIDPAVFQDDDGAWYLIWKNDGNCCAMDTWIQLTPLTADGTALAGATTKLFRQTEDWEGNLVEAPVLFQRGGTYYVFYSANDYASEDYAIGVATASTINGPYEKLPEPLFSTEVADGSYLGPGGQDIVSTDEGEVMFFHSWDELFIYRGIHSLPLDWDGEIPSVRQP